MSYQDNYEIRVPINERENFEKEHTVIYSYGICLNDQYYLKLRSEFFVTVIHEGQERALEKIKRLNIK